MTRDENTGNDPRHEGPLVLCASAAAKSAALALITGVPIHRIEITLPESEPQLFGVKTLDQDEKTAACSVLMDSSLSEGAEILVRISCEGEGKESQKIEVLVEMVQRADPDAAGGGGMEPIQLTTIKDQVQQVLRNFGKKSRGKAYRVTVEMPS